MGALRLSRDVYKGEVVSAFTARVRGGIGPFVSAAVVQPLIEVLKTSSDEAGCIVPVYCFMPDHVHIMFSGLTVASDTWLAMVLFKSRTGKMFFDGGFPWKWQPKFHDHVIRGCRDWRAHAKYVANNPVRAGLVETVGEYPFTGCMGVEWNDVFF